MKNKLTVFWIEDNPIQFNVERKNGKQYPKFLHEEFIDYCLFQHPKQVEEYLSMINVLKNTNHSIGVNSQITLPDVVVFDYKMANAFKNNLDALSYHDNDHSNYLKSKSASHKLKETFEEQFKKQLLFLDRDDVKGLEYGGDKFKKEINAKRIELDDEFGLYCGIAIVREFKEYITIGVPATINKADKTGTMSYNSLFYEWINSYDLKGAIKRPTTATEKIKDWVDILNFSADLLRKRIETQIQTGKATPDYSQLTLLAEGEIPDERIFSFETIYGKRDLPLDGLFIDKSNEVEPELIDDFVQFINGKKDAIAKLNIKKQELEKTIDKNDKNKKKIENKLLDVLSSISELSNKIEAHEKFCQNERNIEIWRFANRILSCLPISHPIIKKAYETATTLWNTYLNDFEDRIVLSDYSNREGNLNATEKGYLDEIKRRLSVNPAGLIMNECSIQTLLINKATSGVDVIRLTTLITLTKATIELEKQRIESGFSERYSSFTKYEYLDILYPKANFKIPLLLSMNVETDKDSFTEQARSWLSNNLTDKSNKVTIGNIFKIDNWILQSEKDILKSIFYKDRKYHPNWIK